MSHLHRNNYLRGFTLAEMLMVVLILGIAATVVIPMIGNTADLQLSSAARELVSTLLYAQTCAIASQQEYQVVFDAANNSYELQDKDGVVITDPVKKTPYRQVFNTNSEFKAVTISLVNFDGGSSVWFDRLGAPYSGNPAAGIPLTQGIATLQAGTISMNVNVEPFSGRISLN